MTEPWIAILTGGGAVALINGIFGLIMWRKKRKAEKEDNNIEGQLKEISAELAIMKQEREEQGEAIKAQSAALKYLLFDRIQYLGQAYIAAGEVDFDDRRRLNEMHHIYHFGLDGNGDLDILMESVNSLPLKK